MDWTRVLQVIVDNRGIAVHNEALRHGRRESRANGKGDCKKIRTSQRISTLTPEKVHRDAGPSMQTLVEGGFTGFLIGGMAASSNGEGTNLEEAFNNSSDAGEEEEEGE